MSALRTTPHLRGRIRLAAASVGGASVGGGHRVSVNRSAQISAQIVQVRVVQFASFRLLQPGLVRPPLQLPFVPPSVMNRCRTLCESFEHFTFTDYCTLITCSVPNQAIFAGFLDWGLATTLRPVEFGGVG